MYSSRISQPNFPTQLPPCVPMNPTTRTGRTQATKTDRELLQSKAHQIAKSATIEAMASHPLYDVLAYDRAADIVTLRQAMYPQNEPYRVDRRNLTCDCIHFTGAVTATNEKLAAAGLPASLYCKHVLIVEEKLAVNPNILTDAPETWERKRAESLAGFADDAEFGARVEADFS